MDDVSRIKDRLDVVDVLSGYLELRPAGRNDKALCPFHGEKTPSFMVSPERQSWHCFGCAKGGDIFSFVQEKEGVEFSEALKILAEKAGLTLTPRSPVAGRAANSKEDQRVTLKRLLSLAAAFFHKAYLDSKEGQRARDYVATRHITDASVKTFQIGYSPDSYNLLSVFLRRRGFSDPDIAAAGLSAKSARGYYDRFRGRLMFPLWDAYGAVVGFTGRLLDANAKEAKYVNTPQTTMFDKSRVLYALHLAKDEIRQQDVAVLVEGQTDTIASNQAGIINVVASSGTALTDAQLKLVGRFTKNVAMAFDSDDAGSAATERGITRALQLGYAMYVIVIDPKLAKDPDELIKKDARLWREAIKKRLPIMEYYLTRARQRYTGSVETKKAVSAWMLGKISQLPMATEREHYLRKLADILDTREDVLMEDLRAIAKGIKPPLPPVAKASPAAAPESNLSINSSAATSAVSAVSSPTVVEHTIEEAVTSEFRLLALLLMFPHMLEEAQQVLEPAHIENDLLAALYKKLVSMYNERTLHTEQDAAALTAEGQLGETIALLRLYADRERDRLTEKEYLSDISLLVKRIVSNRLRARISYIRRQLAVAESAGQNAQVAQLQHELSQAIQSLSHVT